MSGSLDETMQLPPRNWFDRWWVPAEFFDLVCNHNDSVQQDEFFNNPKLKPLREAYAAAYFAAIRAQSKPCLLRLVAGEFPDFELSIGEDVLKFELTEADRAGRRRGQEYREAAAREVAELAPETELFDPGEEERAALRAIERALELKARKHYRPPPHLLVYVNFFTFQKSPLTGLEWAGLAKPWHDRFASIWLLWGAKVVRCWPNPAMIVAREEPSAVLGSN
ncbi:MAG: hypothetical protein ACE5Q3_15350 [Alphaproteobacteria bacterium]